MAERYLKRILFSLLALHLVVVGAYIVLSYRSIFTPRFVAPENRRFVIELGSSFSQVLNRLHQMDLAPAPIYVRLALANDNSPMIIKKGTYQLPERISTREILQMFLDGKVSQRKVTIPEGLDRWQVADLLAELMEAKSDDFLAEIEDPSPIREFDEKATSLEGYLFPETYFFPEEATPEEVIHTMVSQFLERTKDLRIARLQMGLDTNEWVTFASLVEKESSIPQERMTIASVFHNRLHSDMLLQCDPTIIYSLRLMNAYRGKIYRSDIHVDNPYNTYVYKGLPPGPIANPGMDALKAVLDPVESPFYYFVAKQDGSHYFSTTLEEHNTAVRRFQRD